MLIELIVSRFHVGNFFWPERATLVAPYRLSVSVSRHPCVALLMMRK